MLFLWLTQMCAFVWIDWEISEYIPECGGFTHSEWSYQRIYLASEIMSVFLLRKVIKLQRSLLKGVHNCRLSKAQSEKKNTKLETVCASCVCLLVRCVYVGWATLLGVPVVAPRLGSPWTWCAPASPPWPPHVRQEGISQSLIKMRN